MGMKAYPTYKDSGVQWLAEVPSSWNVFPAKQVFADSKERRRTDDTFLTASQKYGVISQQRYMQLIGGRIVQASQDFDKWKHVEPDDFVISLRSFQGGLEMCAERGCVTWHYVVLKPKMEIIPLYFKWLFKSFSYIKSLQSTCNFIRDGQDLRYSNFVQVPIPFPPLTEQKTIASFLDKKCAEIEELISRRQAIIERLKELKQSIIAEAVTKGLNPDVPMKDSGSEWIGDTPEKWQIVRFSRLVKCKIAGAWGDEAKNAEGDILCIRIADFDFDHFIFDDSGDLTRRNYNNEKITKLSLKQGDILVEKSGGGAKTPVGRAIIFDKEYPALYSNFIEKLILSDGVVAKWFLFVWNAFYFTGRIRHFIKQTTGIQNLDINTMLRSTVVPMPPYHEQNAIVAYLDKKCAEIDELIARQEQIIEKLKELKTSTIAHVVTGKVDVRDAI